MDETKEKVKVHSQLQRAFAKLREKYGDTPDEYILTRFYNEERYFFRNEERVKNLDLLLELKERAAELGESISMKNCCRGMYRPSLAISEVK